jgi:hypothetical protein
MVVFSLGAHRGKRPCKAWAAQQHVMGAGFARVDELLKRISFHTVPKDFKRFVRAADTGYSGGSHSKILEEDWLPAWACALILNGGWTIEYIQRVEGDKDLQIALALEYDIKKGRT